MAKFLLTKRRHSTVVVEVLESLITQSVFRDHCLPTTKTTKHQLTTKYLIRFLITAYIMLAWLHEYQVICSFSRQWFHFAEAGMETLWQVALTFRYIVFVKNLIVPWDVDGSKNGHIGRVCLNRRILAILRRKIPYYKQDWTPTFFAKIKMADYWLRSGLHTNNNKKVYNFNDWLIKFMYNKDIAKPA